MTASTRAGVCASAVVVLMLAAQRDEPVSPGRNCLFPPTSSPIISVVSSTAALEFPVDQANDPEPTVALGC